MFINVYHSMYVFFLSSYFFTLPMKQDIFNICLWLSNILIIMIVVVIIVNKINKANNLHHKCNKERFKPYNENYNDGIDIKTVQCSDIICSKAFDTTANITFYKDTKDDANKTITISTNGDISGISTLTSNKITFSKDASISNNLTVSKDINISNKDNIKINGTKLFDLIYPVGSIYMSINATSPATLFGGTWEQIKEKFLYPASSGATGVGGASTVTLSKENMPSHNHTFSGNAMSGTINALVRYDDSDQGNYETSGVFSNTSKSGGHTWDGHNGGGAKMTIKFSATPSGSISYTGGEYNSATRKTTTKAFSIMPPYYKVYCWRRTK